MTVPINIFYHVLLVNHWREVVTEAITAIKTSGLHAETTTIYVGCLGTTEEFESCKQLFKDNGIENTEFYHSENIEEYEFFTLKVMKLVCDLSPLFYGFYIHSKGISYKADPEKKAGKVWRDYMLHWVIKEWRMNYKAMNLKFAGYDLCAVKIIPKRVSPSESTHASGNYFAFNSEYIKSLKPVEDVDCTNRFDAETRWAFTGEPIIFMPCNLFIDYINRQPSYDEFVSGYSEMKDYCLL